MLAITALGSFLLMMNSLPQQIIRILSIRYNNRKTNRSRCPALAIFEGIESSTDLLEE